MATIAEVKALLEKMKAQDKSESYKQGFDCAVNGANTTNCHFTLFSTAENTREWERGKSDGEKEKALANKRIKPTPPRGTGNQ